MQGNGCEWIQVAAIQTCLISTCSASLTSGSTSLQGTSLYSRARVAAVSCLPCLIHCLKTWTSLLQRFNSSEHLRQSLLNLHMFCIRCFRGFPGPANSALSVKSSFNKAGKCCIEMLHCQTAVNKTRSLQGQKMSKVCLDSVSKFASNDALDNVMSCNDASQSVQQFTNTTSLILILRLNLFRQPLSDDAGSHQLHTWLRLRRTWPGYATSLLPA